MLPHDWRYRRMAARHVRALKSGGEPSTQTRNLYRQSAWFRELVTQVERDLIADPLSDEGNECGQVDR